MPNIYTPQRNAFAQSTYKDQQATALAGSLAFASDKNLVDAFIVGDVGDNGLEAGLAVIAAPAASVQRPGLNEHAVTLPTTSSTGDDIAGVVIRNQQMGTNAAGNACYFAQDLCNVAKAGRSGARLWVRLVDGAQPATDGAVYVRTDAANAGKFDAASGASAVALTNMKFKSGPVDGIALVELM